MDIDKRGAIEQAASSYKKSKMHPDNFKEFDCLTDKEKDLVMKHIAVGEKKENIVAVMNTAPFLWYRRGFAVTENKLYFSKDFYIRHNTELRYIKYTDYDEIETAYKKRAIVFLKGSNTVTLYVGAYVEEIFNFFAELADIQESNFINRTQQLDKAILKRKIDSAAPAKMVEKIKNSPDFDEAFSRSLKLGDIIETPDGLFGISQIFQDAGSAKFKFYGHYLKTRKWDGVEFESYFVVNRLKRNKLKIGKANCEVDFLEIYLHLPNDKTVELGDDCVHKIDEDNAPEKVFYYEYNDCVYFATSEIDDECANNV